MMPIDKELLWHELAKECHSRVVRARCIVAFWCAAVAVAGFILGCWVIS